MKKKIIFLDVDGTLTLPQGDVSDKVQKAISEVRNQGHYVFLCTGRNKAGVLSLMSIGFDGLICSAGGYIEIHGQKVYESSLDEKVLQKARDIFERHQVLYNLETTHMTFQNDEMNKEFVKHRLEDETVNSELSRLIAEQKDRFNIHSIEEFDAHPLPVQKLCFIAHDEEQLIEPRAVLSDEFNFIVHEMFSIGVINGEIIIKGTNKGTAVEFVANELGIPMEDTIGFGDSMNDLEMIQTCAYGVVMENGSEKLKTYATTVCESVQNDGIYHELKRLKLCS